MRVSERYQGGAREFSGRCQGGVREFSGKQQGQHGNHVVANANLINLHNLLNLIKFLNLPLAPQVRTTL